MGSHSYITRSSKKTTSISEDQTFDSDSSTSSIPAKPASSLVDTSSKPVRSLRTPVVDRAPKSTKKFINKSRFIPGMSSTSTPSSTPKRRRIEKSTEPTSAVRYGDLSSVGHDGPLPSPDPQVIQGEGSNLLVAPALAASFAQRASTDRFAYMAEGGPVHPRVDVQRAAQSIEKSNHEATQPNLSLEEGTVAGGGTVESGKRLAIAEKTKTDLEYVDGEIAKLDKTITSATSTSDPKHNKQKVYDAHLKKGTLGRNAITGSYRKDAEFFSGLHEVVKSQVELDEIPRHLRYKPASAVEVEEDGTYIKARDMTEEEVGLLDLDGEMHTAFKENNTVGLGGVYVNYKTHLDRVQPDETLEKTDSKPSVPVGQDYNAGILDDPSNSLLSMMNTDHNTGKPIIKSAESTVPLKSKKWYGDFNPMDFSSHFPTCECPECVIKQKTGIRPRLPHIDYGDDKWNAALVTKDMKVKAALEEKMMDLEELDELMG